MLCTRKLVDYGIHKMHLFVPLTFLLTDAEDRSYTTLLGMFTGFGFGIMAVAAYKTIRDKLISQEKREQEKIDQEDERNITIIQSAALTAYIAAIGVLIVLMFLFMGLGYMTPSYICVGAMYAVIGVFFISKKCWKRRCKPKTLCRGCAAAERSLCKFISP